MNINRHKNKNQTIYLKTILLLLCFAYIFFGHPINSLSAASKHIDLSITPATNFIQINPGQKKEHQITLTQNGSLPLIITPQIRDFNSDNQSGKPVLAESSSVSFISFEDAEKNKIIEPDQSFPLPAHSSKKITVHLNPSQNTVEKEYPLTLLFQAKPNQNNSVIKSGSITSATIGSNLIVAVGDLEMSYADLIVKEVRTPRFIDSFSPISYQILVENTATKSIPIHGQTSLFNWSKHELIKHTFVPDIVLGNSSRLARYSLETESDQMIEDRSQQKKQKSLSSKFSYSAPFLFGPYTIKAQIQHPIEENQTLMMVTYHVFAFPFVFILFFVLCIVFILFYLLLRQKKILR